MQTKIGLIGHNINYSISPIFQNYWLSNLKIKAVYNKIDINPEQLTKDYLFKLIEEGYIGFNVTIPYKETILRLVKQCSSSVKKIKAGNTLYLENNNLIANNTDFFGFIVPLLINSNLDYVDTENLNTTIKKARAILKGSNNLLNLFNNNSNVLIIGAGGASRAVIYALLKSNVNMVYIINRNKNKAEDLQKDFNNKKIKVINNLKDINNISLVVNCTPIINKNPFDFTYINLLNKDCLFYDLTYNPQKTNFLLEAENKGFKILNGLLMLILQGALSFSYWFNVLPKIDKNLVKIVNKSMSNTQ